MTPTEALEQVRAADAALLAAAPPPFPLPIGDLAPIVAGTVAALQVSDWWLPGMREAAGAVLRDVPLERLTTGTRGARPYRIAPPGASPALRALYAVGLADDGIAVVHLGIGSASDGAVHEALNLAALKQAAVIFVVATHALGGDAPVGPQLATSPGALAAGFGIAVTEVDGTDPDAVHDAVATARTSGRPHLIEARLNPEES